MNQKSPFRLNTFWARLVAVLLGIVFYPVACIVVVIQFTFRNYIPNIVKFWKECK